MVAEYGQIYFFFVCMFDVSNKALFPELVFHAQPVGSIAAKPATIYQNFNVVSYCQDLINAPY
jgi:hypothetical protein